MTALSPLEVRSSIRSYQVHVGTDTLGNVGTLIRSLPFGRRGSACAVITDDRVAPLYAEPVLASLRAAELAPSLVSVPAGEASKSMDEVARVSDRLIKTGLDRHGIIVALGGGVVGDLAGFVSAIYYRGVPFVQIPTTVVSQVDSAIGGKTGVNTSAGKNLLGAFYPPSLVLVDTGTLATLPDREFNEGFAEVIKHGVIRDAGLLEQLTDFRRADMEVLTRIIRRNLEIKAEIVAADEFETLGMRAVLNFGHTVGHAIEQSAGYGRFLHGEAISLGMVAAGRLSMAKAGLGESEYRLMLSLLARFGLPTKLARDYPVGAAMDSMRCDKKFEAGAIRFVLTPRLGDAFLSEPGLVTREDLQATVENLLDPP